MRGYNGKIKRETTTNKIKIEQKIDQINLRKLQWSFLYKIINNIKEGKRKH